MSGSHPVKIPYEVILDYLPEKGLEISPMFGCFGIYYRGRLRLFLRNRDTHPHENGIWVASTDEGAESLATELGASPPNHKANRKWILLSPEAPAFEDSARMVCDLIVREDVRIGR